MAATLPEHVKGWNIGSGSSPISVAEVIFWAGGLIYEAGGPINGDLTKLDPKHASMWVEPSERPYLPGTTVLQIDTMGERPDGRDVLRPMAAILHFCIEHAAEKSGLDHDLVIPGYVVRQTDAKGRTSIRVLRDLGFRDSYAFDGDLIARADRLKEVIDAQFPEFTGAVALPQATSSAPSEQ